MQNKKLILIMSVLVLFVGAVAFIAGSLINGSLGPNAAGMSVSVNIVPALELPATQPDVTGAFVERRDNSLFIETKSLGAGGGIPAGSHPDKSESGPKLEVVVTGSTVIYRETTQLSQPLASGNQSIQQTIEEATLDQLFTESTVMVWGRKSGDRIIADVLMYSNRAMIKRVIFEDCHECP